MAGLQYVIFGVLSILLLGAILATQEEDVSATQAGRFILKVILTPVSIGAVVIGIVTFGAFCVVAYGVLKQWASALPMEMLCPLMIFGLIGGALLTWYYWPRNRIGGSRRH